MPSETSTDARRAALGEVLRRSFDGGAWHGPSIADALRDVDADTAASHPVAGAHSIWELTLHLAAWAREVARRLDGRVPGIPPEGDWPAQPEPGDADAWADARRDLAAARDTLLAAVAAMPDARLDELVPHPVPARQTTYAAMLVGVAEHNAYHGGQIALLRRALGLGPPSEGHA